MLKRGSGVVIFTCCSAHTYNDDFFVSPGTLNAFAGESTFRRRHTCIRSNLCSGANCLLS